MLTSTISKTDTNQSPEILEIRPVKVIFKPAEEGGYTVIVPELPGLITEGDNQEECLDNLVDALREYYLSYYQENEEPPITLEGLQFLIEIEPIE